MKVVLITAGPTREHLDPVRFMTNGSSGRMGIDLAAAAKAAGAKPILVIGPTSLELPPGVETHRVVSAAEMHRKVMALQRRADVLIGAAAVSDWRFAKTSDKKIKRKPGAVTLKLIPNPDIIKEAARRRKKGQVVVGFALETHDRLKFARKKLAEKGLDMIVANGPENLGSDSAGVWLVRADSVKKIRSTKAKVAAAIIGDIL